MFIHCNGLNYSVVFDAASFLGLSGDYELLKQIEADLADPSMFQDMVTIGDSLTMISQNTQLQTIITFYRVGSSTSM